MNKLIIDTTDNKKTVIKLKIGRKTDQSTRLAKPKSQTALLIIDSLIRRNKLMPQEIDEIEVNTGPGSFTGTRVGVSIANALGFGLGIKVNNKPLVEPKYN